MKEFWNERYREKEYIYGETPNIFFQEQLRHLSPGKLLLPADGEGRNGVFAARMGWTVTSFDYSEAAREKAMALAHKAGVRLEYLTGSYEDMDFPASSFDAVALIFAHFSDEVRASYHRAAITWLSPGGTIIQEAFHPDHLEKQATNPSAGGPRSASLLYTEDMLKDDFQDMDILLLEKKEVRLQEGKHHFGESVLVRMVARKPVGS